MTDRMSDREYEFRDGKRMGRLSRKEVKAKRQRLQGRKKISKTELSKWPWKKCELCGALRPIVPKTGMCGVCVFGEAGLMFGGE